MEDAQHIETALCDVIATLREPTPATLKAVGTGLPELQGRMRRVAPHFRMVSEWIVDEIDWTAHGTAGGAKVEDWGVDMAQILGNAIGAMDDLSQHVSVFLKGYEPFEGGH
jgi:hypothetical protein